MVKLRLKEKNMNMNKRNWVEYEIKIKKSWAEEKTWGKHQKYKNSELDKNSEAVALHTVVSLLPSASELDHFHCNHQAWTMANTRVSRGVFSTSRIAVTHPQGSCVMIFSLTLRWNVKRKCGRVSKVLTDFAISAQSSVCGCCGHPWPALGSAPAYEHLLNMFSHLVFAECSCTSASFTDSLVKISFSFSKYSNPVSVTVVWWIVDD